MTPGDSHLEAARAHLAAGDAAAALAAATQVPPGAPDYRAACLFAVALAQAQDHLTLALDSFIAAFLRSAPADEGEVETLEVLARLYERHGFPENAAEIARKLTPYRPEYRETADRLEASFPPAASVLPGLPPLPTPAMVAPEEALRGNAPEPAAQEASFYRPGAVIGGRYRLQERIGAGGASVVFRATDLELGDDVAVKVLTQAVFDPETDARLRRELMLSRQIVHRNIVRVFEMGMIQGLRYLIMELLVGRRLADHVRSGPLPLGDGIEYLIQACTGLNVAHDVGSVHRDVKPGNLFITTGGVVKVMDFGLAKLANAPGLTATGVIGGTPAYMAPEQAADFRAVTPGADIYSLGVVAYEMFTGTLPFVHENPLAVLVMHRDAPPPSPLERNPDLPPELVRLILRCLEKDVSRRFQSGRDIAQCLIALRPR